MRIQRSRILPALIAGVTLLLIAGSALWWLDRATEPNRHSTSQERKLAGLQTVQGRLTISLQGATLEQKLWVVRPFLLRTETESGPSGFAGTIVVLNDQEGWVYSRALNMATVVSRSADATLLAGETGTGSLLERMPTAILSALQNGAVYHAGEQSRMLDRAVTKYEIVVPEDNSSFPPGVLQVWLDDQYAYPLAWRDSLGRELRFSLIEFNREIDPVTFVFFPPPGAAVQRISPAP
jgi:outer membrane lipoprotein-sorting protein